MRVLIIDTDRCGLDLAIRAQAHGHEVKWFRPAMKWKDGRGFGISTVEDYRQHMQWAKDGLVLCTVNNKYMVDLDRWREFGIPVFGPTQASAKLEIDRAAGMEVIESHGFEIPKYHQFTSLKEAFDFAMRADEPYVFKTMGDEDDKSLSFVAEDPGQMADWIKKKLDDGMRLKGPCMLQEKIDMVCEVGIANYVGPTGFHPDTWEISFEHKKLMPGNFGPNTGEQGTVTQYVKSDPLVDVLRAFERHLIALGHCGDIALNGGIDTKGRYWIFEWTGRMGWPDQFNRIAMNGGDPVQFMRDMYDGKFTLRPSYKPVVSVVMAQRPYPYGDGTPEEVEGKTITGIEAWDANVHPAQVMMGSGVVWSGKQCEVEPMPKTSGPYVLIVTGTGKGIGAAHDDAMDTIKKVNFSDRIVRNDIGMGLEYELPKLHRLGFARDVKF